MEEQEKAKGDLLSLLPGSTPVDVAKKQANRDRMAKARAARDRNKSAKIVKPVGEYDQKESSGNSASTSPASVIRQDDILWFTEVDKNDKGKVANDYPAYYFDASELKEEIRILSGQIEDGVYEGKRKREACERLAARKERLDKIEEGRPKLSGSVKDRVAKVSRELGEQIRDSMFSYDSHWQQRADPHTVAERMVTPCIEIKNGDVAAFAEQRGMRIVNGKISQNDAQTIYKVMSKVLGESSDVDRLRPIRAHGNTI
jgi:hypothetical protein